MKLIKNTVICAACMLLALGASAYAANGDIAGDIYSTDILAYLNGKPIDSYNIGGRTAIVVEDFDTDNVHYGFSYMYDDEARTLTVASDGGSGWGEIAPIERGTVGKILGHIYETDIQVIFNGVPVTGYNIDGRTAVVIEDLGTVTEDSINADYGYSDYLCNFKWDSENREVYLNTYQTKYESEPIVPKVQLTLTDDILTASFDQLNNYDPVLYVDFSEDFAKGVNRLMPIYMDGDIVGEMYFNEYEILNYNLDRDKIYEKTRDLAVVLSYDEARAFVEDGYDVIDTHETNDAMVYIAEKDGVKHVFIALKNGGLVYWGEWDYTTVEFRNGGNAAVDLYVYPFGGPHGATGMTTTIIPGYYSF